MVQICVESVSKSLFEKQLNLNGPRHFAERGIDF